MITKYAYDKDYKLVYIDDVENGDKCNCVCPCCGDRMLAKNGGRIKEHHFSHESGYECKNYQETLLHIWSKEIIAKEKKLFVPSYESKDGGCLLMNPYDENKFFVKEMVLAFDGVEVEERNDLKELQPDIVGINDGFRLWIEIFVSHKCDEQKIQQIQKHDINCIEIEIPKSIDNKDDLSTFLLTGELTKPEKKRGSKWEPVYKYQQWLNYPHGEDIIRNNKIAYFKELKLKTVMVKAKNCQVCFRKRIIQRKYEKLLENFRNRLPSKYDYIFRIKSIEMLVNRYPNLIYLKNALFYNYKTDITGAEMDFAQKLSELFELYKYGSLRNFYWNCPHVFAVSIKNEEECVFCSNPDFIAR